MGHLFVLRSPQWQMRSQQVALGLMLCLVMLLCGLHLVFSASASTQEQAVMKAYLEGTGPQPLIGDAEDAHMRDVRILLDVARVLTALLVIGCMGWWPRFSRPTLRVTGGILASLPAVLAVLPWDVTFSLFHAVLFPQGNWTFPWSSPLIQMYPGEYFVRLAVAWGLLVMVAGLSLLAKGLKMRSTGTRT